MGKSSRNRATRKVMVENKPESRRGLKVFGVAILLVIGVAVLGTFCFLVYRGEREAAQPQTIPAASTAVGKYTIKHDAFPRKHWFKDTLSPEEIFSQVDKHQKKIASLLEKYKNVSPLSEQIYKEFADFRVSIFRQGASQTPMISKEFDPERPFGDLEICFIPEDQGSHPDLLPAFAWYRSEWKAVMQRDDLCPDAIMAAVLYHELGHALFDKQGAASSSAPTMSDLWIEEEIKTHELEGQILDCASQGRLTRLYNSIIARVPKVASLGTVVELISEEDLAELDGLFGLEQEPNQLVSVYLAEFEIGLLFRAIGLLPLSAEAKLEKKLAAYRWVADTVQ